MSQSLSLKVDWNFVTEKYDEGTGLVVVEGLLDFAELQGLEVEWGLADCTLWDGFGFLHEYREKLIIIV